MGLSRFHPRMLARPSSEPKGRAKNNRVERLVAERVRAERPRKNQLTSRDAAVVFPGGGENHRGNRSISQSERDAFLLQVLRLETREFTTRKIKPRQNIVEPYPLPTHTRVRMVGPWESLCLGGRVCRLQPQRMGKLLLERVYSTF